MTISKQFAFILTFTASCLSLSSPSQSQPRQFDEATYKRVTGDMKSSMEAWHSSFVARMVPAADDVIVEALNFYSYGNPSGPGQRVGVLTTIDTGWKNVGKCIYQRVNTIYNDKRDSLFTIHGRSALISIDLNKIDWNASTVKSDYNTVTKSREYKVILSGLSDEFYNETINYVSEGDTNSRNLIVNSIQKASKFQSELDAPFDRILKSLSLAKAQCGGIKSAF